MFGNFAEIAKLMGRAKEIQAEMKKFKEELPTLEFSATGMGGLIQVTVSGDMNVKRLVIDPAAQGKSELAGEIALALNSALGSAKLNVQERMKSAAGGIDLPGLM